MEVTICSVSDSMEFQLVRSFADDLERVIDLTAADVTEMAGKCTARIKSGSGLHASTPEALSLLRKFLTAAEPVWERTTGRGIFVPLVESVLGAGSVRLLHRRANQKVGFAARIDSGPGQDP
jgi:hypothetical protein